MAAPIVKGIVIASSIIVGAAIVLYESPELRIWLDERRRRIAIAMYSVGDSIHPASSSRASDAASEDAVEAARRRRQDIIRRNRAALIKRAQEEGIAVDLDELASFDRAEEEEERSAKSASSYKSFDEMLSSDGKLKGKELEMAEATGSASVWSSETGLRNRSSGWDRGASFANPFDDEAQLLYDRDLISPTEEEIAAQAEEPRPTHGGLHRDGVPEQQSNLGSITEPVNIPVLEPESAADQTQSQFKTDDELEAEIEEAIRRSLQDIADSPTTTGPVDMADSAVFIGTSSGNNDILPGGFPTEDVSSPDTAMDDSLYAPPTPRRLPSPLPALRETQNPYLIDFEQLDIDDRSDTASARTLSEAGFSTISGTVSEDVMSVASQVGTDAQDIADLTQVDPMPIDDSKSEADMSEYSVVGASTPGSWTDVESDSEMEEVGNGSSGQRS